MTQTIFETSMFLSRPLVSSSGMVLLGTSDTDEEYSEETGLTKTRQAAAHSLIIGKIGESLLRQHTLDDENVDDAFRIMKHIQVPTSIRAMEFVGESGQQAILALDSALYTVRWGDDEILNSLEISHGDYIRDLSISAKKEIISGGFDHRLAVTDIREDRCSLGNIGLFDCRDIVGSCMQVPNQPGCISCTTDGGQLLVFDVRAGRKVLEYKSVQERLFSHSYDDDKTIVLGFGRRTSADRNYEWIDLRMGNGTNEGALMHGRRDSHLSDVGSIIHTNLNSRLKHRRVAFRHAWFLCHRRFRESI